MSDSTLTRCVKTARFATGLIACLTFLLPATSDALSPVIAINNEAKTAKIQAQPVRGGLTVLMGSGGNITVLKAGNEILLVDSGISYSKKSVKQALDAISTHSPKFVINTHYHWDHTDGNGWLYDLGATIVAQENTRRHLGTSTRVDDWEWTFPATPPASRPTVLIKNAKTLRFHETTIQLQHYGPSHTDSDISAYFKEADVLATGDTFWNGHYPFIDNENGGSIDGMVRAADENLAKAGGNTIVIPGHGPVGDRADLVAFRDMLRTVRESVLALKAKGLTRDQIVAERPTKALDAKWGEFVIDGSFFTRLVYDGLSSPQTKH